MAIAVKALTTSTAQSKTAGTTLALATGTAVNAYDTMVALVSFDPSGNNVPTVTLSDGTNSFTAVGAQFPAPATTSSGTGVITQAFVFMYTASATARTLTATFSASITAKSMTAYCFTGASATLRGTYTTARGTGTGTALTTPTANIGDVTIAFGGWEQAGGNTYTSDTDTTNGSWVTGIKIGTTGGNTNTNITTASQYKIQTTANSTQTFNGVMSNSSNNSMQSFVLQPGTYQILTPTGISDTPSLGTPVVGVGAVTLSITGISDTPALGTPVASRSVGSLESWGFFKDIPPTEYVSGYSVYLDASLPASYPGSGTTWTDLSGNARHGTLTSGPTYNAGHGAIILDGTDDYVTGTIPTTTMSSFCMQGWVNIVGTNGGCFFKMGNNSGGIALGMGSTTFENDGSNLIALFPAIRWIATTTSVGTGWKFVSMNMDASSVPTFYINGVLVSGTYSGTAPTAPTTSYNLGRCIGDEGTSRQFQGQIGSFLTYNRVVTAAEVLLNFNRTKKRYGY